MSKHPEILWAQRSSEIETAQEKVGSSTTSYLQYTCSPPIHLGRRPLCPQLERSIRDNQPSRYCRIISPIRSHSDKTSLQGAGWVCHPSILVPRAHSLLHYAQNCGAVHLRVQR